MCCTGKNRIRNLPPEEKFVQKWPEPSQTRSVPKEMKFRGQRAESAVAIPLGPVARPLGRPLPVRWRAMPITIPIEYTGGRRKPFVVEGYEFSKANRIQAVDVADVGELLKRPDFRGKK